jgi:hypothetical protein
LEAYLENFIDFIYGSLISTKALGQDEKTKAGPNGTSQEEEVQIEES